MYSSTPGLGEDLIPERPVRSRGYRYFLAGLLIGIAITLFAATANGQGSKTPINNGILQSDLDAAGYKILSANLSDYAGANMTWNAVTNKFDATGGGGGNVSNSGTPTANQLPIWTDATHIKGVTAVSGGTTGQVLKKNSATDYDWAWGAVSGTGTVTTTGSPATGNMTKFSGATSITNATAGTDYWDTKDFVASGALHAHGLVPDPGGSSATTKFLREDATWAVPAGGGIPGGSNTNVQINDGGAFYGDSGLVYNKATKALTLGGNPTFRSITANTGMYLNFMPNGSVSSLPVGFSIFGTDFVADSSNWERLAIFSKGTSDVSYSIGTDAAGTGVRRPLSIAADGTTTHLRLNTDGSVGIGTSILFGSGNLIVNGLYGWAPSDTALFRNAAGVVEINNGTPGAFRDLIVRNITINGTCTGTGCGGAGGNVSNSGTPTVGQYGRWVTATTIEGVSASTVKTDLSLNNVTNDAQIKASDFPSTSVDGEISLFSGTTGKAQKRATGNGLVTATAGVYGTTTAPAGAVVGTTDTQTLTNKRVDPRTTVSAIANSAPTPDVSTTDEYIATQMTVGMTFGAPTGSPVQGTQLIIRIKDNGSAQTIAWNATYKPIGVTLPTTTVAGKILYVGCIYNATVPQWDVVAVAQE